MGGPAPSLHRESTDSLIYLIFGQSVTNREIGATEFRDYTDDSLDIINTKVQNGTDIDQCCNYEYQILDKFCARQPRVRLMSILLVCQSPHYWSLYLVCQSLSVSVCLLCACLSIYMHNMYVYRVSH